MMKQESCLRSPPLLMVDELNYRLSEKLGPMAPHISDARALVRSNGPSLDVEMKINSQVVDIHVPLKNSSLRTIDGNVEWCLIPPEARSIIADYWVQLTYAIFFNGDKTTIMEASFKELLNTTKVDIHSGTVYCFDDKVEGKTFLKSLIDDFEQNPKSIILSSRKLSDDPKFKSYTDYIFGTSKHLLDSKMQEYLFKMCWQLEALYHPHQMVIWVFD